MYRFIAINDWSELFCSGYTIRFSTLTKTILKLLAIEREVQKQKPLIPSADMKFQSRFRFAIDKFDSVYHARFDLPSQHEKTANDSGKFIALSELLR